MRPRMIAKLYGLRKLFVDVQLLICCYLKTSVLQTLLWSPYRTVAMSDGKMPVDYYVEYATERSTVTKQRQRAEKLQSALLDPRGNDVVAETFIAKESRRQEERARRGREA